jgi:hypothetical protein
VPTRSSGMEVVIERSARLVAGREAQTHGAHRISLTSSS